MFAPHARTALAVVALAVTIVTRAIAAEPAPGGSDVERAHALWGELLGAIRDEQADRARALAEELVAVERRSDPPDAFRLAEALSLFGSLTMGADRALAERSLVEAYGLYAEELGVHNPFSGRMLGVLADAWVRRGDLRRARLAMDRSLELAPPTHAEDAIRCSHVYELCGGEARARECAELAVRIDPASPSAKNALAWIIAIQERPSPADLERAEALARSAVESAPEAAAFADTLGAVLLRRGAAAEAAEIFDRLVADERGLVGMGPDDEAIVRLHAALAFEATGRPERAAELALRIRELPPARIGAQELAGLEARLTPLLPQHSGTLRDR